jgi:hypothetical protein
VHTFDDLVDSDEELENVDEERHFRQMQREKLELDKFKEKIEIENEKKKNKQREVRNSSSQNK